MPFTQEERSIAIDTPLGKDVLLLTGFSGTEKLSVPFSFQLEMLSESHTIAFPDIIGKNVTVSLKSASGDTRYFNGLISRFSQGRGGGEAGGDPRFSYYAATMVPWLWLLTRTADSRIFQNLSVPEIVEEVFTNKTFPDYEIKLHETYDKRDYCVQYRESDFNFVSRLLEEEGIYYFFQHEEGRQTLVLTDNPVEHKPCLKSDDPDAVNGSPVLYQLSAGGFPEENTLSSLEMIQEIRPGKCTLNDFNFQTPDTHLAADAPATEFLGPGAKEAYDIYDYPGGYGTKDQGKRLADIRMEEEEAAIFTIKGAGNCRAFTGGYRFELQGYYRDDMNGKAYALTSVEHKASESFASDSTESELSYTNNFECIPQDVQYRPPRKTRRPVVEGVQTAIVVGPEGEKIYTDEHGRVKVQFHWDRQGEKNENSSCWMRVSQVWAGSSWGSMHIPHVGHEVVVSFVEGDPDRPLITGRVYHGTNKPTYPLPDEKHKSVFRDDYGNELVFDGTPGDEYIRLLSPHHNSGITLGRSAIRTTDSDSAEVIFGNRLEACVGTKSTGNVGAVVEGILGISADIKAGSDWNFLCGGSHTLDVGYRWDWSLMPEVKHTDKDALSTAKQDYIIAAGDQMCLVGGARKRQDKARSIVNLFNDKITFSIGNQGHYLTKQGTPRRGGRPSPPNSMLYNPLPKGAEIGGIFILSLLAAGLLASTIELGQKDGENRLASALTGLGAVAAWPSMIALIAYVMTESLADKKIEPVEHKNPAAKIEMKKDGAININSKGKQKQIELKAGDRVLCLIEDSGLAVIAGSTEFEMQKDKDITLNSEGDINIISKDNIFLYSKNNLYLESDKEVKAKGKINHPNFIVLA